MSILTDSSVRDFGRIKQTLEMRSNEVFYIWHFNQNLTFFYDFAITKNSGQILKSTR